MSTIVRSVIVRLRAEMDQFKKEWGEGGKEVDKTRSKLADAEKQTKRTEQSLNKSGTAVEGLSRRLKNNRSEWDQVGTSLLRTGAALTGLAFLVGKTAISWETAWTGVTKTVDGTPEQLAKVESGLRELARTMPETHEQIAAVAEAAGQLGVQTDSIIDFTRVMVMLGDTTNLSADEAATSIAQLMNVMQTAPEDVDRLASTIVYLGNQGASTERQIVQMAQRIAGAGEIVGLTEANVLALANALASSGIEVEAGGSAMSNILIDISKAVDTNSSKLGTWAKVAGTSADQFAAKWKSAPAQALADFTEGLGRMASEGGNVFGTLEDLGQSDIRVTRALLNMANAGDVLRQSLADGDAEWDRNKALMDEANKRYDTTAAKAQIAWNNIKDNAIDAGQAILPVVSSVADAVVGLSDAFGWLGDPVKGSLGLLAGGTGVALLAAGGFMKMAGAVRDTRQAFNTLELSSSRVNRGLGKVGKTAGVVGAAMIALNIASKFRDSEVADISKFTEAILELGDGTAESKKNLDALGESELGSLNKALGGTAAALLEVQSNSHGLGKVGNELAGALSFGGFKDKLGLETLKAWDAALTDLAQKGATEEAARGFEYLSAQATKVGVPLDQLKDLVPEYSSTLQDAANDQRLATESMDDLSGGSRALAERLSELSPDAEEAAKKLAQLNEDTQQSASSFYDFTTDLDDAKLSFSGWLKELEKSAKAQEQWADNLIKATQRGVDKGVIDQLEKAGPEGAKLLADLAKASDKEIAKVNKNFESIGNTAAQVLDELPTEVITQFKTAGADDAIETAIRLVEQYGLTPDQVQTILDALDYSSEDIKKVTDKLADLDTKSANPTIDVQGTGTALEKISALRSALLGIATNYSASVSYGVLAPEKKAYGGAINGTGGPTSDNILVAASPGEHMWTAAEVDAVGGQASMYSMRAAVRAGRLPRFAVGGSAADAWNESYRASAAAYSTPVRSVQAAQGSMSTLTASASIAGARLAFEGDGLARIIDGRVDIAISQNNDFQRRHP